MFIVAYEICTLNVFLWLPFSEVDLFRPMIESIVGRDHIHVLQPIMAQGAAAEVLIGFRARAIAEAEARPQDVAQAEAEANLQDVMDTLENPTEVGLLVSELLEGDDTEILPIFQILFEVNVLLMCAVLWNNRI